MPAKEFHLGDILSITTERLVAPRGMDAVYDILNYMTGDNLFTHQLPRAYDECRPWLIRQHAWLDDPAIAVIAEGELSLMLEKVADGDRKSLVVGWLSKLTAKYGEMHMVETIPADDHEKIHPYDELVIMRGTDEGIVVVDDEKP